MISETDVFPNDYFLNYVRYSPHAPFLLTENTSLSFSELFTRVCSRSAFFHRKNVQPGTKVAIYSSSYIEILVSFLALWRLGAVFMPMNISLTQQQLELIESIVPPDIAFSEEKYNDSFGSDFPHFVLSDAPTSDEKLHLVQSDDLAMIMFTSGTSGLPKAVPITFGALTTNAITTASRLNISPKDRLLINSPPYYTSPIIHILTMLVKGGSIVADTSFLFGDTLLTRLKENNCTGFGGVPVHFTRILAALKNKKMPDTVRFLMNSGEHLPVPLLEKLREKLNEVDFFCAYGLTEVAGRLCILDADKLKEKMGSVGKPLEGMTVSVRDESGNNVLPMQKGEVYTKGTCLMSGYLNRKELNQQVMTSFGFATGDIGYLDKDKFLFLVGRKDDIIKVGAEKVSVKMIEQAIFDFPSFDDFMVAPKWSEHMGTVPCLYYVLKKGELFDQKTMISHLKSNLPSSHIPSCFIELNDIPRSPSGKIIKTALLPEKYTTEPND